MVGDFCGVAGTPAASRGGWGCVNVVSELKWLLSIVVFIYTILHYWQPCIFQFKVHTFEVIQSIKQLIFFTALCQAEDVEVVLGEIFQRCLSVLKYLRGMGT